MGLLVDKKWHVVCGQYKKLLRLLGRYVIIMPDRRAMVGKQWSENTCFRKIYDVRTIVLFSLYFRIPAIRNIHNFTETAYLNILIE
jgi:hypothetical protein